MKRCCSTASHTLLFSFPFPSNSLSSPLHLPLLGISSFSYEYFFSAIFAYFPPCFLPTNVSPSTVLFLPSFSPIILIFSFTPLSFSPIHPLLVSLVLSCSLSSPVTSRLGCPKKRSRLSELRRSWKKRGRLRQKPLLHSHRSVCSSGLCQETQTIELSL